jgi:hypothetical protein
MADKKPLVVDLTSGKTRQIATGETVPLANGGTGATTQAGAANAVLPTQSGHSGEFLTTNGSAVSWGAAGGGGTVTTTGSPASGFLAFFSGATSITSGDLSGDVSTSGTGATTIGALKIATGMVQASAITLAKIQNAAASSKLLGSGASGSGSAYVEITLGTNLSMSGTTLNASGGGGSGTVTSVDAALPTSVFSASSGAVTTSGTLTFTFVTQTANLVWAGPSTGSPAAPTFRALVVADLPTVDVPHGGTGATTLSNHGVLLGQAASAIVATTAGTAGQALLSNGASADPSFQTVFSSGTWTPALKFGGASTSLTYSLGPNGTYKRLLLPGGGSIVFVSMEFALSAKGSSTGVATITGLPFASSNNGFNQGGAFAFTSLIANGLTAVVGPNTSTILVFDVSGAQASNTTFSNTNQLILNFFYFTD